MTHGTCDEAIPPRSNAFRWRAFGIHFTISLIVLLGLLYLLFFHWFPGYLFDTDGGWQALRVIAGVDIILGPFLTLIAASPAKPASELRKDFAVIGIIQAGALSAGTWLAWDNRPYAQIWYDGVVSSMPWSTMREEPMALAALADRRIPHRVTVDIPFEPLARGKAIAASRERDTIPLFDAQLYRPWPPEQKVLRAFETIALELADPESKRVLEDALNEQRQQFSDAVLIPARSRYETYFLLISVQSGEVLESLRINPNNELLSGLYSTSRLQKIFETGG